MAFTTVTVTGSFERPDGQPAQGDVTATLSGPMQNGAAIIGPSPIRGILVAGQLKNDSGVEPFTLLANDDPGTTPTGTSYEFVLELDVTTPDPFSAVISHTAGTIDLSGLT